MRNPGSFTLAVISLFLAWSLSGCVSGAPPATLRSVNEPNARQQSQQMKLMAHNPYGGYGGTIASAGGRPARQQAAAQDFEASRKVASVPRYGEFYRPTMGVLPAPAPASEKDAAKTNPNIYVASTYIGGTGERDRVEKLIREGVMVDGKRVRLEAFSRSYGQTFPIPTASALNVVAQTERAKIVQTGDHTFLQVGVQAIKGESPRRPPLNVALVIDRSGSMGDEGKLENAKSAAGQLVDRLGPNDTFALVAFDDTADVLVPAGHVHDRAALRARIAALQPGGGTNIYGGLQLGYREAARFARPDSVSRVILLSDGEVTSGETDPQQFRGLVSRAADRDVQTTAVGLGVEYNEDLMLGIAREGKGNYHFIRDGADTRTVFRKEMDELTNVVAKAVKLRVVLGPGVGLVRVLGSAVLDSAQTRQVKAEEKRIDRRIADELGIRTNRQSDRDEPGIKLLIPNFYRGDNHVVMMELAVPPGCSTDARRIADVYLKYKDLVATANREVRTAADIVYTPNRAEAIASVNRSVKKNLLGFQTGEALAQAASLMDQGQVAAAVKKIDERMVVLGVAAREWSDRDLDRDGRLLERYRTVLADIGRDTRLAQGDYGQYLKRSLTYAGYQRTR